MSQYHSLPQSAGEHDAFGLAQAVFRSLDKDRFESPVEKISRLFLFHHEQRPEKKSPRQ